MQIGSTREPKEQQQKKAIINEFPQGQKENLCYLSLVRSIAIGMGLIGAVSCIKEESYKQRSAGREWCGKEISTLTLLSSLLCLASGKPLTEPNKSYRESCSDNMVLGVQSTGLPDCPRKLENHQRRWDGPNGDILTLTGTHINSHTSLRVHIVHTFTS